MLKIKFKYKDAWSRGEWKELSCECESVRKCIEFYGLGIDCEYEIISVEKI